LVVLSTLDIWVLPIVIVILGTSGDSVVGHLRTLTIFRLLRGVRAVRMLKLLRNFSELWLLMAGLMRALKVLSWVVVLILCVLYAGALFTTATVGKQCVEDYPQYEECPETYGEVFKSMYTLFEVLMMDMGQVRPVVTAQPWIVLFFICFLYVTSFGLMNIVMGVLVEQTLESSADHKEKAEMQKCERQRLELGMMRDLFNLSDKNCDGMVSLDEFLESTRRKEVQSVFEVLGFQVSRKRLASRLFEVLDVELQGNMGIDSILDRALQPLPSPRVPHLRCRRGEAR